MKLLSKCFGGVNINNMGETSTETMGERNEGSRFQFEFGMAEYDGAETGLKLLQCTKREKNVGGTLWADPRLKMMWISPSTSFVLPSVSGFGLFTPHFHFYCSIDHYFG